MENVTIPVKEHQSEIQETKSFTQKAVTFLVFIELTGSNIKMNLKHYLDLKNWIFSIHSNFKKEANKEVNAYYTVGRDTYKFGIYEPNETSSEVYVCVAYHLERVILVFKELLNFNEVKTHFGIKMTIKEFLKADSFIFFE